MEDRKTSAWKADFADLGQEFRQEMMDLKLAVNTRLQEFEQRVEQQLGEVGARIVTTVFQLAEALQTRVSDVERSDATVKHRLAMLEERLTELEKRLNIPPQRVQ